MDGGEGLRTDRLALEPLSVDHAAEMVAVLSDAELYNYTGGVAPTRAELERRYASQVEGPGTGDEWWFNWIVRRVVDAKVVGFVQATVSPAEATTNSDAGPPHKSLTADVAWLIGVDFQGHRFAVEAAGAMCDWLRTHGVDAITAHIHPDHAASQRVAGAIGLTSTGQFDDEGEEVWS